MPRDIVRGYGAGFLCLMMASSATADDRGVPDMAGAPRLQKHIQETLLEMGCRIPKGGHLGVKASAKHSLQNPSSCHEVSAAIDIKTLSCVNNNLNEQNLHDFALAVDGIGITVCYKEIGKSICLPGHDQHVHVGRVECTGCADSMGTIKWSSVASCAGKYSKKLGF